MIIFFSHERGFTISLARKETVRRKNKLMILKILKKMVIIDASEQMENYELLKESYSSSLDLGAKEVRYCGRCEDALLGYPFRKGFAA